ncbi:MAG: protein kinase [Planctomycetales bacterium]|nr:protein kinase [Planctomycetales bacterium]
MPVDDRDLSGTAFGGYDLLDRIGVGGMGTVYRARQRNLDKIVALKILAPKFSQDKRYIARFIREARAAGRLAHPNVVQGFDVGEVDGRYFFAMELVDGESLLKRLTRAGPLREVEALKLFAQVADALRHASQHGIVHRDVKPDNILMTREGTPKLADLGLAKVERPADEERTTESSAGGPSTREVALGTPAYISPEQVRGSRSVDVRSDFYSLGMSLYHVLTNQLPFPAPSRTEMLARHLSDPCPDARKAVPSISRETADLIRKLGEKDPDDRPQTAEELIEGIEAARRREPLPWETAEGIERRRRYFARRRQKRLLSQGAIAAGVLSVLAVGLALVGSGGARDDSRGRGRRSESSARHEPSAGEPEGRGTSAPAPPPEDPAAAEALRGADAFAEKSPADLPGQEARYREVAEKFEDTAAGREASRRLEKVVERLRAARKKALDEWRKEVLTLATDKQFADAFAALAEPPAEIRGTPEADRAAADLRKMVEGKAWDEFEKVREEVERLVNDRRYADAQAALEAAIGWGVATVSGRATTILVSVRRLGETWERARREATDKAELRTAQAELAPLLAARDTVRARDRVAEARRRVKTDAASAALDAESEDVEAVAALVEALDKGGAAGAGKPFQVGKAAGVLKRIERGRVVLALGGGRQGEMSVRVKDLDPGDFASLADLVLPAGPSRERSGLVVFLSAVGDLARARERLAAGGFPAEVGKRLAERLGRGERLAREREVDKLLAAAEERLRKRDGKGANEILDRLERDFADAEAFQGALPRRIEIRGKATRLLGEDGGASGGPSGPPGRDPGLLGLYHQRTTFVSTSLKGARVDGSPNFEWTGEPFPGVRGDSFGVRWIGFLVVGEDGDYKFRTHTRGGIRLVVADRPVIDDPGAPEDAERVGTVKLEAGVHPLVIEYRAKPGGGRGGQGGPSKSYIRVLWTPPGKAEEALPSAALTHLREAAERYGHLMDGGANPARGPGGGPGADGAGGLPGTGGTPSDRRRAGAGGGTPPPNGQGN